MAPEQLAGDAEDARTDVFLTGMVLARLRGQRGAAQSTSAVPPRKPGSRDRRQLRVGASLRRVVERCLSVLPRDRYPDMDSLGSHLVRVLRAETSLSTDHLICRALAAAGLRESPKLPAEPAPGLGPWSRRTTLKLIAAAALPLTALAVVFGYWGLGAGVGSEAATGVRGVEQRAAELRVLAQPWAEVSVDGQPIDTTPIGRPIQVAPGRHEVRFKHPNSADQVRSIEVIAGQTIWLDVAMPVVRPTPSALPAAGRDDSP